MTRYKANQIVDEGIYWNTTKLAFTSMDERGRLPGEAKDVYVKVPALLVLPLGLAVSLGYVIFLPFVGFVLVGGALAKKAGEVGADLGRATVRVLEPAWEPARAFLSKRQGKERGGSDEWSEEASRELAEDEKAAEKVAEEPQADDRES